MPRQLWQIMAAIMVLTFAARLAAVGITLHLEVQAGTNAHHMIEACFKAFARALRMACSKDKRLARTLPSTKGLL